MSCDFCNEREGIETVYNKIYGNRNRIVYETENFMVFPCLGQLREGHLLIVSKKHINAMGMLDRDNLKELENLILFIGNFYKKTYNMSVLCFEHGVLDDKGSSGGCGIYHMHLHLVPIRGDEFLKVVDEVNRQGKNKLHPAKKLEDVCQCIVERNTYVFFSLFNREQKEEMYIINNSENYFESQYFRQVVATVFGNEEWNWKMIKDEEETFLRTLEKFRVFWK